MALIIPKNNADEQTLDATLKIYYDVQDWVENEVLIDRLSQSLIALGIENEKKEPQSYTKKTQVLAYFGFITWEDLENSQSRRKITELGISFYEARLANDNMRVIDVLIKSLASQTFGRNVIGCDSDSDIEAPNVFIKASLLLNGLNNKQFAFILGEMELGNKSFEDALLQLKLSGYSNISSEIREDAKKWADPKPITALKNWGLIDSSTGCIPRDIIDKYGSQLLLLRTKNNEAVRFKGVTENHNETYSFSSTPNPTYSPYLAAIRTKPFLLLAGISGTGKSRIVRELARACWAAENENRTKQVPDNYALIPVKPNWHDSTELIGYVSRISGTDKFIAGPFIKFIAKAWKKPGMPHFLCLDEMNLAPVEQYFAEYLSVIETRRYNKNTQRIETDPIITNPLADENMSWDSETSVSEGKDWYSKLLFELFYDNQELHDRFKKEGISLPPNLIVMGTVNMDETTFSFSRKVLDRAMTIEMNEVNLRGGLGEDAEVVPDLSGAELIGKRTTAEEVYLNGTGDTAELETMDAVLKWLKDVNDKLEGTPFKIAYRTRNEVILYVINSMQLGKDMFVAFDEAVNMKILPRIEGDKNKVDKVLENLQSLFETIISDIDAPDEDKDKFKANSPSISKLKEMIARRDKQYYCTYWS